MFSVVININRLVEKSRKGRKSNGLKWFKNVDLFMYSTWISLEI